MLRDVSPNRQRHSVPGDGADYENSHRFLQCHGPRSRHVHPSEGDHVFQ